MSRSGRGSSRSSSRGSNRSSGGGGRSSSRSNNRSSGGGRSSSRGGGRSNDGGGNKNAFSRIGSLTVSKSCADKLGEDVVADLQDSGYQVWGQIYLPEGTDIIKLQHEEKILITFKEVDGAPDFVVGTISVAN